MKFIKPFYLILSLFLGLGGVMFANNLQVETSSTIETNCNGGTFPVVYYAGASAITVADTFKSNSSLIWRFLADSSVSIYNPQGVLQLPAPLDSAFPFYSNGKPANVSSVVVTATPISISTSIPNGHQRSSIVAQLVYKIKRYSRGYKAGSDF